MESEFLKTKHVPPGPADEVLKFWWNGGIVGNEKKYAMTRRKAEQFLEEETKKAPIAPKDLKKELEIRDLKIEELEAKVNELLSGKKK